MLKYKLENTGIPCIMKCANNQQHLYNFYYKMSKSDLKKTKSG